MEKKSEEIEKGVGVGGGERVDAEVQGLDMVSRNQSPLQGTGVKEGADAEGSAAAVDKQLEQEVGSGASSKKRPFSWDDVEDPYENMSDGEEYGYNSEDTVDTGNSASYTKKVLKKLQDGTLGVEKRGAFKCPFDPTKPKDGRRDSLIVHAYTTSQFSKTHRARAEHGVITKFLCGGPKPEPGKNAEAHQRRKMAKKARKTTQFP